jgi:hypothetical protein
MVLLSQAKTGRRTSDVDVVDDCLGQVVLLSHCSVSRVVPAGLLLDAPTSVGIWHLGCCLAQNGRCIVR